MTIQLAEFLIDTIEKLLCIVKQQNSQLAQLGAVSAEEQLQEVEAAYSAAIYSNGRKEVNNPHVD